MSQYQVLRIRGGGSLQKVVFTGTLLEALAKARELRANRDHLSFHVSYEVTRADTDTEKEKYAIRRVQDEK